MIENYPDLNREETIDAVSSFDAQQLQDFLEFERSHKDRKTVVDPLERELVTVRPAVDRQYIGGHWFDDLDDEKTVRRSTRVEQAIESNELEVV